MRAGLDVGEQPLMPRFGGLCRQREEAKRHDIGMDWNPALATFVFDELAALRILNDADHPCRSLLAISGVVTLRSYVIGMKLADFRLPRSGVKG